MIECRADFKTVGTHYPFHKPFEFLQLLLLFHGRHWDAIKFIKFIKFDLLSEFLRLVTVGIRW